jgi:hypothetical protein
MQRGSGVVFSFNRSETDPAKGRADLKAVIELLAEKREISAALGHARQRAIEGDEHAPADMLRLERAITEANRRLADFSIIE